LTASNLKNVLWNTLLDVRAKRIEVEAANAVSQAAKQIMGVVNSEIKIVQMGPSQFSGFIGSSDATNSNRLKSQTKER
jgi:hypothetical protein